MDKKQQEIFLAAGCFWGVEYYLRKLNGVIETKVGYCGGDTKNPKYKEVCTGDTGHLEVVKVIYDVTKLSTQELLKFFFEIHDFCQTDGQGPDIGSQYLSAIFYTNEEQRKNAIDTINLLSAMHYNVSTQVKQFIEFWCAEDYHQEYYSKNNQTPYCHSRKKIF